MTSSDVAARPVVAARAVVAARVWRLRPLLRTLHLYLSIGLALLLIPIALSGAALVWRESVDRALNPDRYAVTGSTIGLSAGAFVDHVKAFAGPDQLIAELRYPQDAGWPVRVTTRAAPKDGRSAGAFTVTLDPPTGRVLGSVGISASLVGVLHNFHHMLSVPQYSGRQIVGWVGVGLLLISLSGLYLWWPRNANIGRALQWRRAPQTSSNVHHAFGFWMSFPLAIVSLTGIYMSFPKTAFWAMSSITTISAPMQHGYGALPEGAPRLHVDRVVELARSLVPGAEIASITWPMATQERDGQQHGATWTIQLRPVATGEPQTLEPQTLAVEDHTGVARVLPRTAPGNRAVAWIQAIHEGRVGGLLWSIPLFLTGVLPLLFLITGVMMWMRRRSLTQKLADKR